MIGGNTTIILEKMVGTTKNAIGGRVPLWGKAVELCGFLDLSAGEAKKTTYNAKIEESTHVFICDYKELTGIKAETCRAVINGERYEVKLIDDPMGLHRHLEIYLKYEGGQ